MVGVAPLRRALGVAARPGRHINSEHQRVGGRQGTGEQVTQPLDVDAAAGQGGIRAAPAAPVSRLQAQVRQRRERRLAAEQGITQLEQRIGAAGERAMQLGSERTEPREGEGWHRHGRAA
jgi:hypothetical protein